MIGQAKKDINWRKSVIYGFLAGVVNYVSIFTLYTTDNSLVFTGSRYANMELSPFNMAWALFLNAHNVSVTFSMGRLINNANVNWVKGVSEISQTRVPNPSVVPGIIWLFIPIIVLVISGYKISSEYPSKKARLIAGASIVTGYIAVVTIAIIFASFEITSYNQFIQATANINSKILESITIAGVLYPSLFGGLGGVISLLIDTS